MSKQQKIWELEHSNLRSLPTLASDKPAAGVIYFVKYLKKKKIKSSTKVIDVGCGKGRNTIFLAQNGFNVYAMDYAKNALDHTRKLAEKNNLIDKIHLYKADIDKKWSFEDNFFDLTIDSFSSIDIETKKGREIYKHEMYRTLKREGLAFVSVVSSEDDWEKKLIKESPGKEKNSTIWPQNGKFQKDYDEDELRHFYREFKIVELRKVKKKAFKLGKNYIATDFWVILRKN